jgi:acyl-CoA thioesterase
VSTLADVLSVLDLTPSGDKRFRATSLADGGGEVAFGGQLLGQSLVAAARAVPDKEVLSMHSVFARGASTTEPLDLEVDLMHTGRAFASVTVTVRQRDRLCVRSIVLLHTPDEHLIRHARPSPAVEGPDHLPSLAHADWWQIRVAEGADIIDPDAVGPAELRVWSRVPGVTGDRAVSQALLAWASDGFLIGTAMRPHPGFGQALAHVSVSTTVLAQTLTFHEPFDAGEWLLLDQRSTYAGRGRSHGRAEVYAGDGRLVASFSQESMIRGMPSGAPKH